MKLYFSPGACSLSPHIVLREAGIAFELVRVDLRAKKTEKGEDFLAINPKGQVPTLQLDDGAVVEAVRIGLLEQVEAAAPLDGDLASSRQRC